MEALKTCLPQQQQQQQQRSQGVLEEEVVWAVENGSVWGEEFSVDDLLNLEFVDNEEEEEEEEADSEVGAGAEHKETEDSNSGSPSPSFSSSSLSFEPPPLALSGISLPAFDAEEFDWVSLIMDDSQSEFPSCPGVAPLPLAPRSQETEAQTENRGAYTTEGHSFVSPTLCILSTEAMVPVKAKRSKRSRTAAAAWSMSGPLDTTTTSSSSVSSSSSPALSSDLVPDRPSAAGDQSLLLCGSPPPAKKPKPKRRGRKPKPPPSSSAAPGERRCTHCGAQKTPQWRAGPLGAKTLCNACGVRFNSGRLLPEYRPACSPTFLSHVHSNCHRKVLEMRRKKEGQLPSAAAAGPLLLDPVYRPGRAGSLVLSL